MKTYKFDLSVDAWLQDIEIEANTEEEAKAKLQAMSLRELLDNGCEKDKTLSNIDFTTEGKSDDEIQAQAKKAWFWNQIISKLNNEEAYYDGWIWIWPDGEDYQSCVWDFGEDDENFEDLERTFFEVYQEYHDDGICNATPEELEYCHKIDKQLGLKPIENLVYNIKF